VLLRGNLRKKGLIFLNERHVTINSNGVLNYYDADRHGEARESIDLSSVQVQSVRFQYTNAQKQSMQKGTTQRPSANVDDEFRIYMQNHTTYIFRASKVASLAQNPTIEKWERVIRKFA